jgi:uncharacterized protein YegL
MNRIIVSGYLWRLISYALMFLFILGFVQSTEAQTGDLRRLEMIEIAQRYATYSWDATTDNIVHANKEYGERIWMVDTPDAVEQAGIDLGGWWETDEANIGIPYQWGGWSSIEDSGDSDLNLIPDYDGLYFNQQIEHEYSAGDIYTNATKSEYPDGSGIDCSGLISRTWRTGTKYGSRGLRNLSRPIKFEDLRAGDLLYTEGHVMLFNEFLTSEHSSPGTTRIRVFEASGRDWKVSERDYLLNTLTSVHETWQNKSYETNRATLTANGIAYVYTPRTYLYPIDIVLVIDKSGSMSGANIDAAKNSAKLFVDLMRAGDKVGVVAFNTSATVTYSLTEIDTRNVVKTSVKNAIDNIYATGGTSIGSGLQRAHEQLSLYGEDGHVQVMVLLSDGLENTSPYVANVLPNIDNDNIAVNTIGLGMYADQSLLRNIATTTDGIYRYSPTAQDLLGIYNSILANVYGSSVVRSSSGVVAFGETVEERVLVDSSIGSITFSLFWPGSDLDLFIVKPDGSIIDPEVAENDPNITFTSGPTYEFYNLYAPEAGEWVLRIFGKLTDSSGEEYTILATAEDAMMLMVMTDKSEYMLGNPIKITASVEDSYLDVIEPQYITGMSVQVLAHDPTSNQYILELYDDGLHEDGEPNDGIYANIFSSTNLLGSYNFNVRATGVSGRQNQSFTREHSLSVVVTQYANLPPTLDVPYVEPTQYSDDLNFTISASDPNDPVESLSFSHTDLPNGIALISNGDGTATVTGIIAAAPGTYDVDFTITDPDGLSDTKTIPIVVYPEVARATYTGPMLVSTSCADCPSAIVPLRATIQDVSAVFDDPDYDPYPGNITNATVSFVNRDNSDAVLCTTNVALLDPSNQTTGTAACDWAVDIGKNAGLDYTIGIMVHGYYIRNSTAEDTVVVVSKPTSNFITGGGYFLNNRSGGAFAGDSGLKSNFGMNIKFTKKLTALQGRVTIIVHQDGNTYHIKTNALSSLVAIPYDQNNPQSGSAELIAKANVTNVTDPLVPIELVGNATMQVRLKDNGEPGSADLLSISLWGKDNELLFSSNWDGVQTIPQVLNGGNLQIH